MRRYKRRQDLPFISIVVPVRNEEKNLRSLLESIMQLDYPFEKMEVILVDDESEDGTSEIAHSYAKRFRCDYRVISADHSKESELRAKTLPLAQGIDIASGELILMTDGDCVVPRNWARAMISYFSDRVGIVCGITLPRLNLAPGFPMTWFESVDWSFLLGVCAGFAGIAKPLALIGNNYAVRRETYEELGTFRAMEYNSIDDMALQRAVQKSGKWRTVFPVDWQTVVKTLPIGGIVAQARQRRRWAKGKDIMDRFGQMILVFAILTHLTWPLWIYLWDEVGIAAAALVAIGDYIVITSALLRTKEYKPLVFAVFYPFYTFIYGWLMVFFLLSSRTVQWKSRPFNG
ncbi:glycosyltransferase [bacterium]|nr:MAG: glycosyltransferase [bacterium]